MGLTIGISAILFILGAVLGSFLSVLIYRVHTNEGGIIRGRSKCRTCSVQLQTADLIPIVSFLAQRGKCRHCSAEISYMYPALEVITGLLFVALFIQYPFITIPTLAIDGTNTLLYLLNGFYIFVLIFTFFYDLKYMEVADRILIPAILVGLIAPLAYPVTPHIIDALLGLVLGAGFFGLQYVLSHGKWIGLGDVRIGAFMGIILGWQLTLVALFLSYIIGSFAAIGIILYRKKLFGVKIPLGPFLALGTIITLFWGDLILRAYIGNI